MIYGNKAVDKETIKAWYDALEADRNETTLQSQQSQEVAVPPPISRSLYTTASIRCTIERSKLKVFTDRDYDDINFATRTIDDRYLVFHVLGRQDHFYVVDTFNDDIQ